MQIRVKLHASLRKYLPRDAVEDTVLLELPAGATVAEAVSALGIPSGHAKIAMIDGAQADLGTVLQEGQQLSLFPPLAG
ncbi:MAG: hypothetical protein KatS3mg077_3075 [Candidatus Binatia bacterium]|nr:MAG: hypothetical protein KatS3mg077_3075 [Candidatus Binatia bacterium]